MFQAYIVIVRVAWRMSADIRPFAYVLQRISRSQDLVAETVIFPSVAACVRSVYRDRRITWRTCYYIRPLSSLHSLWGVLGARWGRVPCGGALGVLVFAVRQKGTHPRAARPSRRTPEPVACSSDEDVHCINIKIVLHLRTNGDGR